MLCCLLAFWILLVFVLWLVIFDCVFRFGYFVVFVVFGLFYFVCVCEIGKFCCICYYLLRFGGLLYFGIVRCFAVSLVWFSCFIVSLVICWILALVWFSGFSVVLPWVWVLLFGLLDFMLMCFKRLLHFGFAGLAF